MILLDILCCISVFLIRKKNEKKKMKILKTIQESSNLFRNANRVQYARSAWMN